MRRRSRRFMKAVEVAERPLPLVGWDQQDGSDLLGVIERDVRDLMHRVAENELALSEKERGHREDIRRVLLDMVEVLDAFERVFHSVSAKKDQLTKQMKKWIANFRTVYRLLSRVVAEQGVSPIETLDRVFDPKWHEPVETVAGSSQPDGTILEELRRGYVWRGILLRQAQVIVARDAEVADDLSDAEDAHPDIVGNGPEGDDSGQ